MFLFFQYPAVPFSGGWLRPFFRGLAAPPEPLQPGTTRGDVTLARDVRRLWLCLACSIVAKCFLCPPSFLRNDKENLLPRLPQGGDCHSVFYTSLLSPLSPLFIFLLCIKY